MRPACNLTVPLLGEGSSLCNARPRVSMVHFCFHSFKARKANWVSFAKSSSFTYCAWGAVDEVFSSLVLPRLNFFNLYPVASFANLSATSLLTKPAWAGTQCNSTVKPRSLRLSIPYTMRWRICCPDLFPGAATARRADQLSTQMMRVFGLPWLDRCRRILQSTL